MRVRGRAGGATRLSPRDSRTAAAAAGSAASARRPAASRRASPSRSAATTGSRSCHHGSPSNTDRTRPTRAKKATAPAAIRNDSRTARCATRTRVDRTTATTSMIGASGVDQPADGEADAEPGRRGLDDLLGVDAARAAAGRRTVAGGGANHSGVPGTGKAVRVLRRLPAARLGPGRADLSHRTWARRPGGSAVGDGAESEAGVVGAAARDGAVAGRVRWRRTAGPTPSPTDARGQRRRQGVERPVRVPLVRRLGHEGRERGHRRRRLVEAGPARRLAVGGPRHRRGLLERRHRGVGEVLRPLVRRVLRSVFPGRHGLNPSEPGGARRCRRERHAAARPGRDLGWAPTADPARLGGLPGVGGTYDGRGASTRRTASDADARASEVRRADWQGPLLRRREGLRLPDQGRRRRRLRALQRAARRGHHASSRGRRSSSASSRAAAASRRCRCTSSRRRPRCPRRSASRPSR